MSILVMATATALSLSSNPAVLLQYSQNESHELNSVLPVMRKVEAFDLGYNSTGQVFNLNQNNVFYQLAKKDRVSIETDYIEELSVKSFAKSSTRIKLKVKNVEKMRITL